MTISIRSSISGTANATSANAPLPAGVQPGDTVVLFIGGAWSVNTSPGWTSLNAMGGANWSGGVQYKTLLPGDIAQGSVPISLGGSFNFCWSMVAIEGAVDIRTPVAASQNGTGSASIALASNANVTTGDLVFLFGSNRGASVNTIDHGTSLTTENATNSSCALYEMTAAASGTFTANFAYATPGSGNYQAIIAAFEDPGTTMKVSRLALGSAVALSVGREQVSRMDLGAAVALSVGREQVTRLTLGVLIDLSQRDHSQAMLGLGAWGF